jgi:DNA-binding CsgD family transcriptional regulator
VVLVERSLLGSTSAAESLRNALTSALQGVREEFDDHLESINDNTNEIQANYEYLGRLDAKIQNLSEKIDEMQIWISRLTGMPIREEKQKDIKLTEAEKEVFLVMYTASNARPVTYAEIANALRESEFLIRSYITNLIEKGVPILKQYIRNATYLSLDNRFREEQAKRNVLNISQTTLLK